jgi:hypothetical protein
MSGRGRGTGSIAYLSGSFLYFARLFDLCSIDHEEFERLDLARVTCEAPNALSRSEVPESYNAII